MALLFQPPAAERVNVIGVPGTGKSYWARNYVRNIHRLVIFDIFKECDSLGTVYTLEEFMRYAAEGQFENGVLRAIVHPDYDLELSENQEEIITSILDDVKNCTFYAEETGIVLDSAVAPPQLRRLAAGGRHEGVSMVVAGQRYHSQFPPVVRGTSTRIIAYRQTEPDDLRDLRQRMGKSVDMRLLGGAVDCPTETAIASLPNRWYIDFEHSTGPVLKPPVKG